MKIKYSSNLEYQTEAVNSVVSVFEGCTSADHDTSFTLKSDFEVVSNYLDIDNEIIEKNLKRIQSENFKGNEERIIFDNDFLRDFSVEMETGTGKTYTYVKTIFELHQKYNLHKFIIVVPSVAIREGVMKTLQTTQKHFKELYGTHIHFSAYEGDTKRKTTLLKQFATSHDIELMIMSIQAFNSDNNIINQDRDDSGRMRMIDRVAHTNPVIILDEPQNMESELSRAALGNLNPLFTLRYSATHKNLYNLVYSLSPFDAYNKGLVKKIEIASVVAENSNERIVELRDIITGKGNPKAKLRLENKKAGGEFEYKDQTFAVGDSLERKTKNEKYTGLYVEEISANKGSIEITGGDIISLHSADTQTKYDIFRVQIRETIKEHMERQELFGDRIKVLSLFFIDRVANYVEEDSVIRAILQRNLIF